MWREEKNLTNKKSNRNIISCCIFHTHAHIIWFDHAHGFYAQFNIFSFKLYACVNWFSVLDLIKNWFCRLQIYFVGIKTKLMRYEQKMMFQLNDWVCDCDAYSLNINFFFVFCWSHLNGIRLERMQLKYKWKLSHKFNK